MGMLYFRIYKKKCCRIQTEKFYDFDKQLEEGCHQDSILTKDRIRRGLLENTIGIIP